MLQQAVLMMNYEEILRSAHDCSQGGLASALADCALGEGESPLGVDAEIDEDLRPVVSLFGESNGRVVLSCDPDQLDRVLEVAEQHGVPAQKIGSVTAASDGFRLRVRGGSIGAPIEELAEAYFNAIPSIMDATSASGA